jgi:hypothetical protein
MTALPLIFTEFFSYTSACFQQDFFSKISAGFHPPREYPGVQAQAVGIDQ